MIIRTIISTVVWFFSIHYALHFGGIWHSQVHPTPNVEVSFKDGNKAAGSLKRAWNGDRVLITADGLEKRFTDESTNYMVFSKPKTDGSFLFRWRTFLPAILLITVGLLLFFRSSKKLWSSESELRFHASTLARSSDKGNSV